MSNEQGDVAERRYFDAFGDIKSYIGAAGQYAASFLAYGAASDLAFTGHRWLQSAAVVHMKGRVYDPLIARFMSADPHIQSPQNSQSLNRYAYVWNNPLSFTDPSGYFLSSIFKALKKLFKAIGKIIKSVLKAIKKVVRAIGKALKKIGEFIKKHYKAIIAVVVVVVVAVYAPKLLETAFKMALSTIKTGAIVGGVQGLVRTGSLTGLIKGAFNGAINGAKGFLGGFTDWRAAILSFTGLGGTGGNWIQQALRQGLKGGILNKLHGGSFSKGFNLAALGSLAGNAALWVGQQAMALARKVGNWLSNLGRRHSFQPRVLGAEHFAEIGSTIAHEPVRANVELEFHDMNYAVAQPPIHSYYPAASHGVIDASVQVVDNSPWPLPLPGPPGGVDFSKGPLRGTVKRDVELERAVVGVVGGAIALPLIATGCSAGAAACINTISNFDLGRNFVDATLLSGPNESNVASITLSVGAGAVGRGSRRLTAALNVQATYVSWLISRNDPKPLNFY